MSTVVGYLPDPSPMGHGLRFSEVSRRATDYHVAAPPGAWRCRVCGRVVIRGLGEWWAGAMSAAPERVQS